MIDPARAVLLALLHEDARAIERAPVDALDASAWDRVLAEATAQRVRPLVHRRLIDLGWQARPPAAVWQALEQASRTTAAQALMGQAELARLARELAASGIPVVALKGVYLSQAVYGNSALREMNDVDVLVRREHLRPAVEALRARGYEGVRPFDVDLDAAVTHHVTELHKPGSACVEVHWNITKVNQPFSIDPVPLWDRTVPFTLAGASLLALSPEDTLLHACVHVSYHHRFEFGLRPFCDISAIIRVQGPSLDWTAVHARATAWKWLRGTWLALALAKELLGAAVPESALVAMRPTDADRVLAAARDQVFANPAGLVEMGGELAQLSGDASVIDRVGHAGRRLFLSRRQMAAFYAVPPDSPRIWWCYVRRVAYLAGRYGRVAVRMIAGRDAGVAEMAARKNVVRDWLEGPSSPGAG